jgi:hypothetical protein
MAKLNEDGNLFGRLTALAALAAVLVWVGRLSGVSICPIGACSSCPSSAAPR